MDSQPPIESERRSGNEKINKGSLEWEGESNVQHLMLYNAAIHGDWQIADRIINENRDALTACIGPDSELALHVAVKTGHSVQFVEKLVHLMPVDSLEQPDAYGDTTLHLAARVGNTKAAKILVHKNSTLPQQINPYAETALHTAALYGHKETVFYLLSVTKNVEPSPFAAQSGVKLLNYLIIADFYDMALYLLNNYPELALERDQFGRAAIGVLARKPHAFESGSPLGGGKRLIYHCWSCFHSIFVGTGVDNEDNPPPREDIENYAVSDQTEKYLKAPKRYRFFPHIQNTMLMHKQAMELLRILIKIPDCSDLLAAPLPTLKNNTAPLSTSKNETAPMSTSKNKAAPSSTSKNETAPSSTSKKKTAPLFEAAKLGITEIVVEAIKAYPHLVTRRDADGVDVFRLAIMHRQENIYNLLYQMDSQKNIVLSHFDKSANNVLHEAAKLGSSDRISGAALQMQREWQWFKEVESNVQPLYREKKNRKGKTPRMLFIENHKDLAKEGEKWMKDTASSFTIVAALVVTVVFAAAFTVPGGDNSDGIPIYVNQTSFLIFAMSDILALVSSITSLLMFLGILTSRYAEEDFLRGLPRRLCIGLITLFFAIAAMLVAFSASFYIVLASRGSWLAVPIGLLASIPVIMFVFLQRHLLVEIVLATVGPSIFGKQSDEIIG